MCVIFLVSKTRPTEEMVERAWNHNKDGAGIAWREKDREGNEVVAWEKGIMNLDRAKELCAKVPRPYVVHFRVASVGGVKPSLTHPFQVSAEARLDLKGTTKGAVLFHNGHWSSWNDKAIDAAIHSNSQVPEGSDWSDSRAMAWMTYIYGPGFMELLTAQKGVLMTPQKFNIFTGNGWEKINDVWCSNDYFWSRTRSHSGFSNSFGRLCNVGRCTNRASAGKDICDKCESEKKAAERDANSVGQSQLSIVTGGAKGPLAQTFTRAEVEGFHKAGLISKSMLKKYRKACDGQNQSGNRGKRALAQLQELTTEIAEILMLQAGSES